MKNPVSQAGSATFNAGNIYLDLAPSENREMVEDVLVPSDGENNPDLAVIIMNPVIVSKLE